MNRRQRKKAFKKVFGMNPAQYEKWYREHWPEIARKSIQENVDVINEGLKELGSRAVEAAKILRKGMDEWAEEIRAAAGFIETDNMLRKSSPMPEGADKKLLKHIGIRVDRCGAAYDFYYDEANEAYFAEVLPEGGR